MHPTIPKAYIDGFLRSKIPKQSQDYPSFGPDLLDKVWACPGELQGAANSTTFKDRLRWIHLGDT